MIPQASRKNWVEQSHGGRDVVAPPWWPPYTHNAWLHIMGLNHPINKYSEHYHKMQHTERSYSHFGLTFDRPFTAFSLQWTVSAKQSNFLAITFPSGSQGGQILLLVCVVECNSRLYLCYTTGQMAFFQITPYVFDKSWKHSSHAMKSKDLAYRAQLCILFFTVKGFTLQSYRFSSVFYNQKFMLLPSTFGF